MLLRRLGNKAKLAKEIQKHFPAHTYYIEPFFGAGGMFFNKPKAKYNIVNDLDSDVFNLFCVVMDRRDELESAFKLMPVSEDLFQYWRKNTETDPIKKALRFLLLSNYGYMGKPETLKIDFNNTTKTLVSEIEDTADKLFGVVISNKDFRKFFPAVHFRKDIKKDKTLIYADPPYLGTEDYYSHSFKQQDCIDLLDSLQQSGCKFAMSEFNNQFIIEQAKQRNLNIITIGERQNMKNRRIEILITNYKNGNTLF